MRKVGVNSENYFQLILLAALETLYSFATFKSSSALSSLHTNLLPVFFFGDILLGLCLHVICQQNLGKIGALEQQK